ncbi:MAG TPA: 2-amino-4-hydroxy-6-hydroxymethyldihydropteridine diphosphokinase [Candidatus Baltobacteraceae bacterium]|jgi:2-amino-4-hydroxy-6-hydroxymethyldihydropteridine diphosphokinase|nr:2-amino-4-hydroxy-6-hydroxymethyldihydropteridine diphosphokinase [Candidatus Baltobacteraceae bacterium]
MARCAIGIGSNLGDPVRQTRDAIHALEALGSVPARSSLYRSSPWGGVHQPDFVNAVALLETRMSAQTLLRALQAIERRFGRERNGERWGPRVIDLDLLFYDDVTMDWPFLTLPHPRLYERAFVLVPLAEIDPIYTAARDRLPRAELESVHRLELPSL